MTRLTLRSGRSVFTESKGFVAVLLVPIELPIAGSVFSGQSPPRRPPPAAEAVAGRLAASRFFRSSASKSRITCGGTSHTAPPRGRPGTNLLQVVDTPTQGDIFGAERVALRHQFAVFFQLGKRNDVRHDGQGTRMA